MFIVSFFTNQAANSSATVPPKITIDAAQLNELISETKSLRNEVAQLKKQVDVHQSAKKNPGKAISRKSAAKVHQKSQVTQKQIKLEMQDHAKTPQPQPQPQPQHSQKQPQSQPSLITPFNPPKQSTPTNWHNPINLGGSPVLIEPNAGRPPAYNGSDLLTNLIASSNNDLIILQYRENIERNFAKQSAQTPNYYAVLSGTAGGLVSYIKPYAGKAWSDIDLTVMNLTTMMGIGPWVTGIMDLNYYNYAPENTNPAEYGARVNNSRTYISQGYLTMGNLQESPFYATLGQMLLPFGLFYGYGISSPLTAALFSTSERPLLVGYSRSAGNAELDVEAYVYRGETQFTLNRTTVNEWGISGDYLARYAHWSGDFGMGFISNIADSGSMQLNGQQGANCTLFNGYAYPCRTSNLLRHAVPGADIHVNVVVGNFNLISEYVSATKPFSPIDMSYNGKGASPKAFDVELGYSLNVFDRPSSIAVGYGYTKEALALFLPQSSYALTFTTSVWPKTVQSLGYQHNVNYPLHTAATGQTLPVLSNVLGNLILGRKSDYLLFSVQVSF